MATFTINDVAVNEEYSGLDLSVSFNGRKLADWTLGPSRMLVEKKVLVPGEVLRSQTPLLISLRIDQPRTPMELRWSVSDDRRLGFRLTRFQMDPVEVLQYKLGQVIDFTETGKGARFLDAEWTAPDRYGAWTVGLESRITLPFEKTPVEAVQANFVISDCMVSNAFNQLAVRVKANNEIVTEWKLGPDRIPHVRSVEIPAWVLSRCLNLTLSFEILDPRSPAMLGWSADSSLLGIRIARAMMGTSKTLEIPDFTRPPSIEPDKLSFRTWIGNAFRGLRLAFKGVV